MSRRTIALLTAVMICLGMLAAYSATLADSTGTQPLATVTYYEESPNPPGPYEPQRARVYEQYGLKVEFIQASTEQTQALLASGNLPDLIRFRSKEELETAIAGNMLVNLDEHLDKLPKTIENTGYAVDYSRNNLSLGTGNWYAVLFGSHNNPVGSYSVTWGSGIMWVRWDLYTAIGRPAVETFEDLIPVFKAMQDYYPETEDGRKTYAVGLFAEWDGGSQFNQSGLSVNGFTGTYLNQNNMVYDIENGVLMQGTSKDGPYYKTIGFYNQLYRNGLLDPDSMTQGWSTLNEKLEAGVYVAHFNSGNVAGFNTLERANADEPNGYVPLIFDEYKPVKSPSITLGNTPGQFIAISANAADVDACLRFIEVNSDPDALLQLFNGPQGDMWDEVDGQFVPTQKYLDWVVDGGDYIMNDGSTWNVFSYRYNLSGSFLHPKYGTVLNMEWLPEIVQMRNASKLNDEWAEFYGYANQREWAVANERNYTEPYACYFMPAVPDELANIKASVAPYIVDSYWQLIYANSDEEFDAKWDAMEADVQALGGDELWAWAQEAFAQAGEIAKTSGQVD